MRLRISKILMFCVILCILFVPVIQASPYTMTLNPGIIYRISGGGIITFENTITSSGIYFDDFLMFNNLNGKWSQIGFKCTPSTVNMTIDTLDKSINGGKITLSVDAPTFTESVSKIYVGDFGKPSSVAGASSWSYSSSSKTVTIRVIHFSPQNIVLTWKDISREQAEDVFSSIWRGYTVYALIQVTLACAALLGALNGNIEFETFWMFMQVSVAMAVAVFILGSLASFWSTYVMVGLIPIT